MSSLIGNAFAFFTDDVEAWSDEPAKPAKPAKPSTPACAPALGPPPPSLSLYREASPSSAMHPGLLAAVAPPPPGSAYMVRCAAPTGDGGLYAPNRLASPASSPGANLIAPDADPCDLIRTNRALAAQLAQLQVEQSQLHAANSTLQASALATDELRRALAQAESRAASLEQEMTMLQFMHAEHQAGKRAALASLMRMAAQLCPDELARQPRSILRGDRFTTRSLDGVRVSDSVLRDALAELETLLGQRLDGLVRAGDATPTPRRAAQAPPPSPAMLVWGEGGEDRLEPGHERILVEPVYDRDGKAAGTRVRRSPGKENVPNR